MKPAIIDELRAQRDSVLRFAASEDTKAKAWAASIADLFERSAATIEAVWETEPFEVSLSGVFAAWTSDLESALAKSEKKVPR